MTAEVESITQWKPKSNPWLIPVRTEMSSHTPEPSEETPWESVHKCSQCGYEYNLARLDLHETSTGIATCPKCEWSGQIDLQIVPRRRIEE
jgi:hypothetical protein